MLNKLKERLAERSNSILGYLEEKNISVSTEIKEERLNICKSCDQFIQSANLCKICGCFMPGKTYLANASCPIKKWIKIEKE